MSSSEEVSKESHLHTKEQLSAVVQFIVDNQHALKEVKSLALYFDLHSSDQKHIEQMIEDEEPVFFIVYEILERHKALSTHPPTLKSVAQIFVKMGLQHVAEDLERLADTADFK